MGFVASQVVLTGLFGGLNNAKSGKQYLSVMSSPGPKVDKVELPQGVVIKLPPDTVFGTPVSIVLENVDQRFKDFNGSFSTATGAVVNRDVK